MELLPFGDLPAYKPRDFVPADFKVSGWDAIEPLSISWKLIWMRVAAQNL